MGLISDLLGAIGGKKARTIADVEAALARLADERAKARQAVADAMRDRDALLLIDETDKKIAELDAQADRRRLTLERCDKAEPLLLRELEELRSEAKRARWRELRKRYDVAALAHAGAMRAAVETALVMLNMNDEARSAGFEHEVMAAFIPPVRTVRVEALTEFDVAIERAREMGKPAPPPAAPPPKVVAAAPKPAARPTPAPPPPPPKPFVAPKPDADGNVKVTIIRPGIELEGRARPRAGETIALPHADAMRIVRSGHADFAEAS